MSAGSTGEPAGMSTREVGYQSLVRAEICLETSAPPAPSSQLLYNVYAECGKMRRRSRGLPKGPHLPEAEKNEVANTCRCLSQYLSW